MMRSCHGWLGENASLTAKKLAARLSIRANPNGDYRANDTVEFDFVGRCKLPATNSVIANGR